MTASADLEDITKLIGDFTRSGMTTLHLRSGAFEILLSTEAGVAPLVTTAPPPPKHMVAPAREVSPVPPAPAPSPPGVGATGPLPEGAIIVKAPTLGTFYRAPKPGAATYVEIGSVVEPGAELCLIEVMKLFTAVRAERPGRIHAVLAEDGAMVEAGQPLFALVSA